MRNTTTISALTLATCLGGCLVQMPGYLDAGDEDSTSESSGSESSGTTQGSTETGMDTDATTTMGETGDPPPDPVGIDGDGCQDAVDILIVVDNSGSMGILQRRFAESIEALLHPLDEAGVDWRLGVTTTDVGNPWCPPEITTPESGELQMRACNDHLEDFLFDNGFLDVRDEACNEICPYGPGKLQTMPTTTALDPDPSSRPWLERIDGQSNLPDQVDPAVASLCLVPQGINGCGFEAPLRAMELAILRSDDPMDAQFGFIREDASLLVVLFSDEVDCSHDPNAASIFDADGLKTFWADPDSSFPTSAVCWNAGVSCTGEPDDLDCETADKMPDGSPAVPSDAVLFSTVGLSGALAQLEAAKRAIDPGADVGMLVISGLGLDDQLHYTDVSDSDPSYQESFGAGPGCVDDSVPPGLNGPIQALPPVRMLEVAESISSAPLASICAADYDERFAGVLDRLVGSCE